MACLVAVYNDQGRAVGYCCASCYNAKQPSELVDQAHPKECCTCICGGKNHAQGEIRALKNHQAGVGLSDEYLQAYANQHGLDASKLMVIDRLRTPFSKIPKVVLARFRPPQPKPDDLFHYRSMR